MSKLTAQVDAMRTIVFCTVFKEPRVYCVLRIYCRVLRSINYIQVQKCLKNKSSVSGLLKKYFDEVSILRQAGNQFVCQRCAETITFEIRSQLLQHFETELKNLNSGATEIPTVKSFLKTDIMTEYSMDLAERFTAANIPLNNLNCPIVRKVLEKQTKMPTPSEQTPRKNYVPKLCEQKFVEVKRKLADKKKWISIDKTTD